jgi:SAM-dependent methyltransferase
VAVRTNYFDGHRAERYDADSTDMYEPAVLDPAVDFLFDLARGGSGAGSNAALELGIGTGRIALPLSQRGVRVVGIDLSPDMVAQLKAKPGAEKIEVTIGDFTTTRVPGSFGLAYLVYNTIENLTEQDDQVQCFCNVARHLDEGGHFVIEVEIPPLRRLPLGQTAIPFTVTPTRLGFDELDPANQHGVSHHYWIADGTLEVFAMPYRYVWPAELDLMARIAGLRLCERWSSWTKKPFTSNSFKHISVWTKTSASAESADGEATQ